MTFLARPTAGVAPESDLAFGDTLASAKLSVYQWNSEFGSRYTDFSPAMSSSLTASMTFSPSGRVFVAASAANATPPVVAYPWLPGFGVRYADPVGFPSAAVAIESCVFTPKEDAIAFPSSISPYVVAYPWSMTSGFGTKYSNPATIASGASNSVAFSPKGDAIAIAQDTSPYVTVYAWNSSTGFGAKYADPVSLPPNVCISVAFSPSGDTLLLGHYGSPYITAYEWNSSTGFGAKYSNPSTLPPTVVRQVTFSPNGKVVALTTLGTAGMLGVLAYAWNSSTGFGAKYANPATYPSLAINIQFSPSGRTLAVGTHYPPYLYIYPWSDTLGFGAAYTNPAGIGNVNSLAWRPA